VKETRTTCPYCGVGCGVIVQSEGAQITGVRGDPQHPANLGRLCSKGAALAGTASAGVTRQMRLLQPMQRLTRGQTPQPLKWDAALDLASARFAHTIQHHGPDAVGFYVSGQLLTEDYYVFNKLAKGLIGTNNIDTNSRLCMSSAVAGYKKTLGADAPPACYEDIAHAQTLFITGSNTAFAHPVLFRRIEDAKRAKPSLQIVCCDPRRTETAAAADLHLPLQPGTDVMLLNGMLHLMLWEGWVDGAYIAAHTQGFEALKATVRDCTPERVAAMCGISTQALLQATRLFAGMAEGAAAGSARTPTLSLYCQGLNQSTSGTAKNMALINLHLATGQIGRPGAGPFSLTGQPNAMGGREVGGLANLLSAHRDLANPAHRAEVAALWGVPEVPATPGKTAVEMFQAAADGQIKALWIACTNPAQSMPDQTTVRRALERAEFVVVQEAFATTATCRYADLLLPATTWGEKEGTVTNSERRISRVRAAVPAPGQARPDWRIAADLGLRLQTALAASSAPASKPHALSASLPLSADASKALFPLASRPLFPYASAQDVWLEHRASTAGRDLDITGMDYAMLEAAPRQWPLLPGQDQGLARLYADGVFPTPDGRARFANVQYQPVHEARSSRYPFALTTGRLRDQWHGMSRTGTLAPLFGHAPEPVVQVHPQDLARRLLHDGALVRVASKRGAIYLPVQASEEVGLGQAFIAMHWGDEFVSGHDAQGQRLAGVNALTTGAFCPDSKQPEFKHTPVRIEKAELPHTVVAMAWLDPEQALAVRSAIQGLLGAWSFASCVLFAQSTPGADSVPAGGSQTTGLLFHAAHTQATPPELLAQLEDLLALGGSEVLRYTDPQRGQRRALRFAPVGPNGFATAPLQAFLLAGDSSAHAWMAPLLQDRLPAAPHRLAMLRPGATAPSAAARTPGADPLVCTCVGVKQSAITSHLQSCQSAAPDQRLQSLQAALQCGTQCGSCLPQLRRMVREGAPAAPVRVPASA